MQAFSSRLQTNVLAIDYRGFADSEGTPSEHGLGLDARAAWDFLHHDYGVQAADIAIVGHSLGTAVAARLASELSTEGAHPRGVALLAPFSSIRELLDTYYLFGLIPLMKPLAALPGATSKCYNSSRAVLV
jgi:abhydrolase domain-containing protein 12